MKIVKSSEVQKVPVEMEGAKDVEVRWLISKEDGANNFAMRMFEVQPGGCTPLHTHPHEYEFTAEHVIFAPPEKQHQFKNTGDSALRFLCLIPNTEG